MFSEVERSWSEKHMVASWLAGCVILGFAVELVESRMSRGFRRSWEDVYGGLPVAIRLAVEAEEIRCRKISLSIPCCLTSPKNWR